MKTNLSRAIYGKLGAALLAALAIFWVSDAAASERRAWVAQETYLQAGPGDVYPTVAVLEPGQSVIVYGCLEDYAWCDVGYPAENYRISQNYYSQSYYSQNTYSQRGWVYGEDIEMSYRGNRVLVGSYIPWLGLPFISFYFENYWDNYYQNQDWYSERQRWIGRDWREDQEEWEHEWHRDHWHQDGGWTAVRPAIPPPQAFPGSARPAWPHFINQPGSSQSGANQSGLEQQFLNQRQFNQQQGAEPQRRGTAPWARGVLPRARQPDLNGNDANWQGPIQQRRAARAADMGQSSETEQTMRHNLGAPAPDSLAPRRGMLWGLQQRNAGDRPLNQAITGGFVPAELQRAPGRETRAAERPNTVINQERKQRRLEKQDAER
jgi:uncharacterized protein YraI